MLILIWDPRNHAEKREETAFLNFHLGMYKLYELKNNSNWSIILKNWTVLMICFHEFKKKKKRKRKKRKKGKNRHYLVVTHLIQNLLVFQFICWFQGIISKLCIWSKFKRLNWFSISLKSENQKAKKQIKSIKISNRNVIRICNASMCERSLITNAY